MDTFDEMFDLDGDGSLDIGEMALELDFLARLEKGEGDIDWDDDDPEESDGWE